MSHCFSIKNIIFVLFMTLSIENIYQNASNRSILKKISEISMLKPHQQSSIYNNILI